MLTADHYLAAEGHAVDIARASVMLNGEQLKQHVLDLPIPVTEWPDVVHYQNVVLATLAAITGVALRHLNADGVPTVSLLGIAQLDPDLDQESGEPDHE